MLIAIAAVLMTAIAATAAGYNRSMIITTVEGEEMTVSLSPALSVAFSESEMLVKSESVDLALPLSSIKGWTYRTEAHEPGIDTRGDNIMLDRAGDSIIIRGISDGALVILCSADGRIRAKEMSTGDYALNLSGLERGVYVLTVNKQSFKIVVNI